MARSVAIKHEKRISTFLLLLLLLVIEEIAWKHLVPAASPLEVAREKERERVWHTSITARAPYSDNKDGVLNETEINVAGIISRSST